MEKMRSAYKLLVGKPEEKRQLGSPKYSCKNIITVRLKGTGCEDMDFCI
jgi:hypothetical protein